MKHPSTQSSPEDTTLTTVNDYLYLLSCTIPNIPVMLSNLANTVVVLRRSKAYQQMPVTPSDNSQSPALMKSEQ